jgi:starch synthase
VNGFVFDGTSRAEQTTGFIATVRKALALKDNDPAAWKKVRAAARAARFDWDRSAQQTIDELYSD